MKRFKFIYLLLLVLIVTACSQNEMLKYENEPAVYFDGAGYSKVDSINHSFFLLNSDILKDTILVRVNTMGELSSQARPVAIVQTNAGDSAAAVAGVHYVPFDDASLKPLLQVPAGKEYVDIPVVFIRDESLDSLKVRLELALVTNEYFRPGIVEKQRFVLTTTDLIEKPGAWDSRWYFAFGRSWGPVKMRFIIDITGYTDWNTVPTDMTMLTYFGALAKQRLLEYNAAHPDNPLREANGNLVTFNS
ncbi:MAG: DUF4843 domain-containing protein [Proteiniphilum sp.]|nr:DUF4843 domain-containing protein [Proteiniphilum sp.]